MFKKNTSLSRLQFEEMVALGPFSPCTFTFVFAVESAQSSSLPVKWEHDVVKSLSGWARYLVRTWSVLFDYFFISLFLFVSIASLFFLSLFPSVPLIFLFPSLFVPTRLVRSRSDPLRRIHLPNFGIRRMWARCRSFQELIRRNPQPVLVS